MTVICAAQVFLSGKGVTYDILLLSNTVCACAIFAVEMTKLLNLVQKKNPSALSAIRVLSRRPRLKIFVLCVSHAVTRPMKAPVVLMPRCCAQCTTTHIYMNCPEYPDQTL